MVHFFPCRQTRCTRFDDATRNASMLFCSPDSPDPHTPCSARASSRLGRSWQRRIPAAAGLSDTIEPWAPPSARPPISGTDSGHLALYRMYTVTRLRATPCCFRSLLAKRNPATVARARHHSQRCGLREPHFKNGYGSITITGLDGRGCAPNGGATSGRCPCSTESASSSHSLSCLVRYSHPPAYRAGERSDAQSTNSQHPVYKCGTKSEFLFGDASILRTRQRRTGPTICHYVETMSRP